jgi:agmatine deiminase
VKFRYDAYGYRKTPHMQVPEKCWSQFPHTVSGIYLDGGNVEEGEEKVLMFDMVFRKNKHMSRIKLISTLETCFQKEIIFLPCEPGDTLGHVDGGVRFLSHNTVAVNDFSVIKSRRLAKYQIALENALARAGFEVFQMPYAYDKCPKISKKEFREKYPFADDYNPAIGYYINFLSLPEIVLAPQFGLDSDSDALEFLMFHFPKRRVVGVPCYDVGMQGGAINCVTWTN